MIYLISAIKISLENGPNKAKQIIDHLIKLLLLYKCLQVCLKFYQHISLTFWYISHSF